MHETARTQRYPGDFTAAHLSNRKTHIRSHERKISGNELFSYRQRLETIEQYHPPRCASEQAGCHTDQQLIDDAGMNEAAFQVAAAFDSASRAVA